MIKDEDHYPEFSRPFLTPLHRCRHQLLSVDDVEEIVLRMRGVCALSTIDTDEGTPRNGEVELDGAVTRLVETCPQEVVRCNVKVKRPTQLILGNYHRWRSC